MAFSKCRSDFLSSSTAEESRASRWQSRSVIAVRFLADAASIESHAFLAFRSRLLSFVERIVHQPCGEARLARYLARFGRHE